MVEISTKRLGDGVYRVLIDGKVTDLVIGRGDPPKYRQHQMWSVGRWADGKGPDWIANDLHSKGWAEELIATIAKAVK